MATLSVHYVAAAATFSMKLNGRDGLATWLNVPTMYSFSRGA